MNGISKTKMLKWAVNIIIPLAVAVVPCNETFTMQMKLFFVTTLFAICCFALETMNQTGVAILLPVSWVYLGVADAQTVFSSWNQYIPWMTIAGFFLAAVLQRVGLLQRFTYWVVSKTGTTYRGILIGLAIASMLICQAIGSHPMLLATIAYGICAAFDFGRSKASAGIMLMTAASAIVAEQFRFAAPLNMVGIAKAAEIDVNLLGFFESWYYNLPLILFWVLCVVLCIVMFKPEKEIEGRAYFQAKLREMGPMSVDEKRALLVVVIFLGYIITQKIHGLSLEWGMAIIPWLLLFPGIGCATQEDIKKINYGMVFFLVSCMGIGSVATSLGLGAIIGNMAGPLLSGQNVYVLFLGIWALMFIGNFVMTPLAMMAAFTVPLIALGQTFGVNPLSIFYFMFTSFDQIILPYEYVKYLMFFGFGVISMSDFMKYMSAKSVLNFIVCFVLLIPWWMFTGFLYQ